MRAATWGALIGAATDLWLVAIPAVLTGRYDPSLTAHAHAMADAAAGAALPLILAGAIAGVLVAVLRQWRPPTPRTGPYNDGDGGGDG